MFLRGKLYEIWRALQNPAGNHPNQNKKNVYPKNKSVSLDYSDSTTTTYSTTGAALTDEKAGIKPD